MQYTYLGRTGVRVSRLCLGCMSYGDPKWRPWVLDEQPVVTAPIVGATKIEHLQTALAAVNLKLGDEEIRELEAPYQPHRVRGFD